MYHDSRVRHGCLAILVAAEKDNLYRKIYNTNASTDWISNTILRLLINAQKVERLLNHQVNKTYKIWSLPLLLDRTISNKVFKLDAVRQFNVFTVQQLQLGPSECTFSRKYSGKLNFRSVFSSCGELHSATGKPLANKMFHN